MNKLLLPLLFIAGFCLPSAAQNTRQISSRDGLSNSAVMCLFQDSERYLWMGTYDGLNRYDGTDIRVYKPDSRDPHSISGNVVRRIVESREGMLWIMTKGGLNRFSKKNDRVEAYFPEFAEDSSMACDGAGNFFILTRSGFLFYYDFAADRMREIAISDLRPTVDWVSLLIDSENTMWVTHGGKVRRYSIVRDDGGAPKLQWLGYFDHPLPVTHVYYDKERFVVIDRDNDLFVVEEGRKTFVRNISEIFRQWGDISSVVFDGDDIVAGLRTGGIVRLVSDKGFATEKLPVNYGVFSLLKDDVQDVLWVGTDGDGVYSFLKEEYAFHGINLRQLPIREQRPVRAVYSTPDGDLWLGTKGNGIIRIRDYRQATEYGRHNVEHLTTDEGLSNNSVFALTRSRAHNLLWIGSSGPELNYYSFDDNRVHALRHNSATPFVEVHSIHEEDENTLWVSSLFSLYELDLSVRGNNMEAHTVRRYDFDVRDKQVFNKIYAISPENDSILWLAMRGNGAIRLNKRNGDYDLVTFDGGRFAPMNDILCVHRDTGGGLWFGSSYGINNLSYGPDGFASRNYNHNDGIANNTIHGILESADGNLWFSSNTGLTLLDRARNTFRNFDQKAGLKVIEFSDNAYFMEEGSSRCFFGGIDGVVWIEPGQKKSERVLPPVLIDGLRIINEKANINDHMVKRRGDEFLRLRHNQNFFTISFSVNDFTGTTNKNFSYKLDDFSDVWMNTNSREAQFSKIPPGRYVLQVRYDDGSGRSGTTTKLNIEILPPWYMSLAARLIYAIAFVVSLYFVFVFVARFYDNKRRKMADELSRKYKDEMYENKLRFFTNITHEFCTPLTLIHTPGERILSYEGSDDYIKKYARIILSNSERLNVLIQEVIDFRRMETGNKVVKIESCDIGAICGEIMEAFSDLAEENRIDFSLSCGDGIMWNSDGDCITTILNNLVSNAFKYTAPGGKITVAAEVVGGELALSVHNTGKGIGPEDIPLVFNRYSVLDNVERNMIKGISSRNGLGLAICKNMVELLGGTIDIESTPGLFARFIARLPMRELPETARTDPGLAVETDHPAVATGPHSVVDVDMAPGDDPLHISDDRPKILIIDDNEEILFTLRDILSESYTVISAKDGREGMERLLAYMPDLVVTDVMMPGVDGISMTKEIKSDPHTSHIPVVIISALASIDDHIEGIESGADAYISKPFDIQYLQTLVRRLIVGHRKLRDYYNSSASSYDYLDGHLLSNETRDFIRQAVRTIDRNIASVEFSPEDLADDMRMSLRTLYRRFKESGLPSPKDFIRRHRIEYAAKLLLSTHHNVQEIMYMAGFTTRSHFYKEFMRCYGQSPTEYRAARNTTS